MASFDSTKRGRQAPSEAAIPQTGVRFRLDHLLPVVSRVRQQVIADQFLDAKIDDVVDQRAPDQEFHRKHQ